MRISKDVRRNIADALKIENIPWQGRLEDSDFLSRLFDLVALPSTDSRFNNARDDIWKHTTANSDWDSDWVFYDKRFNLSGCDDNMYLRFLCETLHPVVRDSKAEVERLKPLYNSILEPTGYQLIEMTMLAGRPLFSGRLVGIALTPMVTTAKDVLGGLDATYVTQQITRMEASVVPDPALAIGTAKELVETCCRTILDELGVSVSVTIELPSLVKLTAKHLQLTPEDIPDQAKAAEIIRRLLSNLTAITNGVAELRNQYGTGHGKIKMAKGLTPRHAKLAVGAASTLAVFLIETHHARRDN